MLEDRADCFVELSKHIYAPGDLLIGFVGLILQKPLAADRVSVRFSGSLETEARTSDGEVLVARKQFFDKTIELWKCEKPLIENQKSIRQRMADDDIAWAFKDVPIYSNSEETTSGFPAGTHKLPFSFRLPSENLTTSFAAKKCPTCVNYLVTAYFHVEDRLTRVAKQKFPIVVPSPIQPGPSAPLQEKVVKQLGRNKNGHVELVVTMNKSAYLPTERIDCTVTIRNHWKHSLKFVHFCIHQKMISFAHRPGSFDNKKSVSVIDHSGVGPGPIQKIAAGSYYSFSPEYYIPALIPIKEVPNFFKVEYFAKVQVGRAPNWIIAECLVPITIGTHYFNSAVDAVLKEEILVDLSTPPMTPQLLFSPNNPFLPELGLNAAG